MMTDILLASGVLILIVVQDTPKHFSTSIIVSEVWCG